MLDLKSLEERVHKALNEETAESLEEWLKEHETPKTPKLTLLDVVLFIVIISFLSIAGVAILQLIFGKHIP